MVNKWVKIWARGEYNLHKMSQVVASLVAPFTEQFLGRKFTGIAAILMQGGNHAFCMTKPTWRQWRECAGAIFFDARKFSKYLSTYERLKRDFVAESRRVGNRAGATSRGELADLMRDFLAMDLRYMLVGQWTSFYITDCAEAEMQRLLPPAALAIVLAPGKMSAIRKERKQLLEIALVRNPKERARLLERHAKKFEWIPCINVLEPKPWPKRFFERELARVRQAGNAKEELAELKAGFRRTNAEFKNILKQEPAKERTLIQRAHAMAFIKDDRDDIRRHAYYFATPLYQAIARFLKISTADLLLHTGEEIVSVLGGGSLPTKTEINKRQRGYALAVGRDKIHICTGAEHQKYLRAIAKPKENADGTVSGIAASSGVAVGTAKIAMSVRELGKVKKGDILVTGSTHPDYLPAMRLAAAFVTDEGGLTCHAAIVAREMGKPAVVGTKNATQVFKDGDRVEVDAERGVVRKLD